MQGGPDLNCVADIVEKIRALDTPEPVVHLMSIGGWNSPHPDTSHTAEAVFLALDRWNREVVARPERGWAGFDGWDWDLEGNDDVESPHNHFSIAVLDIMGRIGQLAKRHNYIFGMAPAESYLDYSTPEFSRSLRFPYPEYHDLQPEFKYHGRNCYAYLLHKYGKTTDLPTGQEVNTYDFVTLQLYEGFSHAEYALSHGKQGASEYLEGVVSAMTNGWMVEFSRDTELACADAIVSVDPSQLVLGLANGWAGDGKFLFIDPDVEIDPLLAERVRGFAFWNLKDEGICSPKNPSKPIWLAKSLAKLLMPPKN